MHVLTYLRFIVLCFLSPPFVDVCACVRMCACMRTWVFCLCVCVCVCVCACVHVCVCMVNKWEQERTTPKQYPWVSSRLSHPVQTLTLVKVTPRGYHHHIMGAVPLYCHLIASEFLLLLQPLCLPTWWCSGVYGLQQYPVCIFPFTFTRN